MSFISLNCNKNFFYVIVYWVLEIIFYVLFLNYKYCFAFTNNLVHREYTFVILLNIGDLLSGFLVIYTKCVSKSRRDEETKKENNDIRHHTTELIFISDNAEKIQIKPYKGKLILICILDYISRSFYWISYAITKAEDDDISFIFQKDIVCTFDIIMRYIFSIVILKMPLYRHSILSIIIIGIGFAILLISDIFFMKNENKNTSKTLILTGITLLRGLLFPYEDVLVKQLFRDDYILPGTINF